MTEIAGSVAVVTGGANGIGRALALRLAAGGAAGVAIADIDGARAQAVASVARVPAFGMACDVSDERQVAELIERTREELGPIDLFCANAGVAVGTEPQTTPNEVWELAFGVNMWAHVLAARHLLDDWLERGRGHFLATASAAGLLTQIGSAPYAVSKAGAVAFAEWLSVTYGDRGVRVSCLCPMGVNTALLHGPADASPEERLGADVVAAAGAVLEPEDVAEVVVQGLRDERFLILPHPEVGEFYRRKGDDPERWIRGMRRLQRMVTEAAQGRAGEAG